MADPWVKKLTVNVWVAVVVVAVVVLILGHEMMQMSYKAGWAAREIEGFVERDSLFFNRLERGSERYEAEREALARCKMANSPEDCS